MKISWKFFIKWSSLSCLSGVLAGVSASVFLIFLDQATSLRETHPEIVWFLPLGGLLIGILYQVWGKSCLLGNNLIIDEILNPKERVPATMAPLVLFSTVLTHLFGGSAGREGTAVQMGASLSDQLSHFFKVSPQERRLLLITGAGAGFGAAIGAPWAGIIFGMEMLQIGRIRWIALWQSAIASWTAFGITHFLQAPHSIYPKVSSISFSISGMLGIVTASICFGLMARFFSFSMHHLEAILKQWIPFLPLRTFLGGGAVLSLAVLIHSQRYLGLGISVIQEALTTPASFWDPLWKFIFTLLTLGAGFKGGEFIPLVFMGSTLGSALAPLFHLSPEVLGALGFSAVFGAASNTPLACTLMAMELFGWPIGPYALGACFISYWFSGHHGIYKSQLRDIPKVRLPFIR